MNKIKILPENLANQIAAGEVVERPASVVKELVENSLDAGATRITVNIELAGRRLMQVSDDGEGMSRDDAVLSFERHATSKISTLDDLSHIGTLGFRGEALASIASVAKVELLTKAKGDAVATNVVVEGGRLIDVKDAARADGTTVTVRDLFFNTPARRRFMRSEATENYHLTSIVTHYALAYPEIAFTLTNNGREAIRVSVAKDLRERAFQLFGGGLLESLLPVNGGREFVAKVTGFVSAPRERRRSRDSQYFFVNRRFVRDKTITSGLMEGYRSVLPHGFYPVAFLFLELPFEEIDVNVHPAKTEIRFRRGEAVKDVVAEAVKAALMKAGVTGDDFVGAFETKPITEVPRSSEPQVDQPNIELEFITGEVEMRAESYVQAAASAAGLDALTTPASAERTTAFHSVDHVVESPEANSDAIFAEICTQMPPVDSAARLVKSITPDALAHNNIQPLGQLHDSFIIAVDGEGLLLIDQHVAHERILFDKYRKDETMRAVESQHLLLPETIDLTPAQAEAFVLIEDELEQLGFGVMKLSGRTIAIKSIPVDLPAAEVRNLFAEVLDTIEAEKKGVAKMILRDEIAARLACKAAIKINTKLTSEKMRWLIDKLLVTSSPTTCPHGRPVILRLSMRDIERGFHRT